MIEYQGLLSRVIRDGEHYEGRNGGTLSTWGETLKVDMRGGYPLLTTKKIPFKWIATELLWMLAGSTDEHELQAHGVKTWAPWATQEKCEVYGRDAGDLGPTYGFLLRFYGGKYMRTRDRRAMVKQEQMPESWKGHDQLWELCYNLDVDPYSRRHVVTQWDPYTLHEVEVPPCQPVWQVKVHDDHEMSLLVYCRSADVFVGLPFDIAHYGLLLEMLAWVTGRRPRQLVFQFGDLHLYDTHTDAAKALLERQPRPKPEVFIGKDMWHATPSAPGQDNFVNLLQIQFQHFVLHNYDPHPKISAEVSV
jgi:thymidylate synthase